MRLFSSSAWDLARDIEQQVNTLDKVTLGHTGRLRWRQLAVRLRWLADHIEKIVEA